MTPELRRAVESHRAGRLDEAEAILRALLSKAPEDARAHFQLGVISLERGAREQAEAQLREAVQLDGALAEGWAQLALLAGDRGEGDEAAKCLEKALRLRPDEARYWNNLSAVHLAAGRAMEAAVAARQSIALQPRRATPLVNLGRALGAQGDEPGALQALRQAVALEPANADAFHWLGVSLARNGQWTESLRTWEMAARAQPERVAPRLGIANALLHLGRSQEASLAFATAASLAPERAAALESQALFAMHFGDFTPDQIFEAHAGWGRRHASLDRPRPPRRLVRDRVRVGYVSSRFQRSAMAFALLPVLEAHDRARFEVYCYAEREARDDVGERFRGLCDAWRETQDQDDDHMARQVAEDGIDVLVDLAGHTPGNRLRMFARRPAPVALNWLDYFDTTGVAAIDAIVGDDTSLAVPRAQRFVEGNVSVGPVRYPYRAPDYAPACRPVTSVGGEPVTFGSFARLAKITPTAIASWIRILAAVPGSRLLLKNGALGDASVAQALREAFTRHGVDGSRLLLRAESGHEAMLGELLDCDIILDTFPYNGGITTCEALWMGRPVVTVAGDSLIARQGASLLAAVGLPELITTDTKAYAACAVALARDRARLATLSAGLRERMSASSVCDAAGFTRRLEGVYERLLAQFTSA